MSEDNHAASDITTVCAFCGIAEIDDVKLKDCDGCDLVRYCGDECQKNHESEHEEECKKRAAELRDELLFRQPESTHHGDCPICCLPMPLDISKSCFYECCSKSICEGCYHSNQIRELDMKPAQTCPFCRELTPFTDEEGEKRNMQRVKANDPVAIRREGVKWHKKEEYIRAFDYFAKAAALGDVESHLKLACMYQLGRGVEEDEGKTMYHLEKAAIGGHPEARYKLGAHEWINDNYDRAAKHFVIAATLGDDDAIKTLMEVFKSGFVEKDDLAAALRAHQTAGNATKSPQREAAERIW